MLGDPIAGGARALQIGEHRRYDELMINIWMPLPLPSPPSAHAASTFSTRQRRRDEICLSEFSSGNTAQGTQSHVCD